LTNRKKRLSFVLPVSISNLDKPPELKVFSVKDGGITLEDSIRIFKLNKENFKPFEY
jgi:hypothetical protein